ncbi:hypothetical protein ACROYT_G036642 [Oculina patagonica]
MKGVKFLQFSPESTKDKSDSQCADSTMESNSLAITLQNQDAEMKYDSLLAVLEERMKREESILSTSPHKKVVNAIRYAKAINSSLDSSLEKTKDMLHREFEQEIRRILDVQQETYKEFPALEQNARSLLTGVTNRQFRRRLSEALASRRRTEEFRRTRTRLSLPSLSPVEPSSRQDNVYVPISRSKKDSEIVYLPPI